ncbi:MAG: DUF6351 family protein [Micromonosporaceae bacterium]
MRKNAGQSTLALVGLLTAALLLSPWSPAARAVESPALAISVLSSRADLVSGGDALVRVALPAGTDPSRIRVTLDNTDVTGAFAVRPNGRYEGLLTGLPVGTGTLRATGAGMTDQLVITNHPNGGPVFSGPQITPWVCQPSATDAQCNQPASYEYVYRSTDPTKGFQPYDPANPPPDVATTTTDEGVSVPYVVRIETGYQDRDQYKIAVLYRPGEDWAPWAAQSQWNRKLLVTHGGGCRASYGAGAAPSVLTDNVSSGVAPVDGTLGMDSVPTALGRGFAVMSTALNNNGHNCNIVTQAESLLMAKERIVEAYGPIRYTIGVGCSGGSITQQQVANAYPGIYQGLIVTCSYPDSLSTAAVFADYHLLRGYFENPSRWGLGVVWSPTQIAAVEGHLSHVNAVTADEGLFKSAADPTYACAGVTDAQRYHPQSNPAGVRCSILDYMINVLGPRPESVWTPMEQAAGHGFAGVPLGNAGIQYGLTSLRQGLITPAQFVDLNTKVGGLDVDIKPAPERIAGDPGALRNAYRSGAINEGNNLADVAIINHAGPDPGLAHDAYRAWAMRARLERAQGHFANHVIWFGQTPLIGDPSYAKQALLAMDRWLSAVEADGSDRPLADKIVADRPDDIQDRCSSLPGVELISLPGIGTVCELPLLRTHFGTPRTVAGDGATSDVNACALRQLRRAEYYPVLFSNADWGRLTATFPDGVCDWSRPGIGQADTVDWLTYSDAAGNVIYGGTPLGPPPAD